MSVLQRLIKWLSPERRKALQLVAASVVPMLLVLNLGTEEFLTQWSVIVLAVAQFLSGLLSLVNLRAAGGRAIWDALRGLIYSLAMTVAPTLVLLGYLSDAQTDRIMTILGAVLTFIGALVAVFNLTEHPENQR